jgi:predicted O-methyltransferase YrrM
MLTAFKRHLTKRLAKPNQPISDLPSIGLPLTNERGRCAYEGYQRGWGLDFGDLAPKVWRDPLFREALRRVRRYPDIATVVTEPRLMNLFLILRFFLGRLPSQNIIEFGSYKGGSAIFMATILQELHPSARVYALDTYEGMPQTDDIDVHERGDFSDTRLDSIRQRARSFGLENVEFVQGLVEDTTLDVAARGGPFGLAHIDLDIYSAIRYAQDTIWPTLVRGGYLVYDDATVASCIGATQAVEDLISGRGISSEQIWPHFVFRAHFA